MDRIIKFLSKYYLEMILIFVICCFGCIFGFICFSSDYRDCVIKLNQYELILNKEFGRVFTSYDDYMYYSIYKR